jgi:hypothetical protein
MELAAYVVVVAGSIWIYDKIYSKGVDKERKRIRKIAQIVPRDQMCDTEPDIIDLMKR